MELRRIVVGLELGKLSDQAVARAMGLAREFGARLDVVHGAGVEARGQGAAREAWFAEHGSGALERARDAARGKLALMVEDPLFAGRPVDDYLHVSAASGARALVQFARQHEADLIVIGSHRRRNLIDLGGTARVVLAKSRCPVWMEPAEALRFERVLAPIDLSASTARVLETARSLAARYVVPVRVLHAFVPPELAHGALDAPMSVVGRLIAEERAAVQDLVTRFDWGALPVETDYVEGEPARAILHLAGPQDLIVMGTHGHSRLARAMLGSCADRVLKQSKGPVLVVPLENEDESKASPPR
jgi:nucleotide-binding universal stress UspA family protein